MEKVNICHHNYHVNPIKIVLKVGKNTYEFRGYINEKNLVCISNSKEFLEKAGYKILNSQNVGIYEILDSKNNKIILDKVYCICNIFNQEKEKKLNNIYLEQFCEKTEFDFEKIDEKTYEVIIKSIKNMKASDKLIEFLKTYEGFREKVYTPANDGTHTIGYGTVVNYLNMKESSNRKYPQGKENYERYLKNGISKEEATKLLKIEVVKKEKLINEFIQNSKKSLNQNQFDAFISLAYNFTSVFYIKSNSPLMYEGNFLNYIMKYGIPKPSEVFESYRSGKILNKILPKDINTNNLRNIPEYFERHILDISKGGGEYLYGLKYRRVDELNIFYYADYTVNKPNKENENEYKEKIDNLYKVYYIY